MTITTKEKHLANTDIEIPQHALVRPALKFLTEFVAFLTVTVYYHVITGCAVAIALC